MTETDYPRAWDWEADGSELEGAYLAIESAPTAQGKRPILVLEVNGEPRTVWLFHEALVSKFREELEERPEGDLRQGEPIVIKRGEKKTSQNGRDYVDYRVRFPEAPKRSPLDMLGVSSAGTGEPVQENAGASSPASQGDDIPW
jgi:hypothetical protein